VYICSFFISIEVENITFELLSVSKSLIYGAHELTKFIKNFEKNSYISFPSYYNYI
jgi:hypothetical protein